MTNLFKTAEPFDCPVSALGGAAVKVRASIRPAGNKAELHGGSEQPDASCWAERAGKMLMLRVLQQRRIQPQLLGGGGGAASPVRPHQQLQTT